MELAAAFILAVVVAIVAGAIYWARRQSGIKEGLAARGFESQPIPGDARQAVKNFFDRTTGEEFVHPSGRRWIVEALHHPGDEESQTQAVLGIEREKWRGPRVVLVGYEGMRPESFLGRAFWFLERKGDAKLRNLAPLKDSEERLKGQHRGYVAFSTEEGDVRELLPPRLCDLLLTERAKPVHGVALTPARVLIWTSWLGLPRVIDLGDDLIGSLEGILSRRSTQINTDEEKRKLGLGADGKRRNWNRRLRR